jgi:hypothetical protein
VAESNVLGCVDEVTAETLTFSSGRTVECRVVDGRDEVIVRGIAGDVELEVLLTPSGPVLRFRAAELVLESKGRLALDCHDFALRTRGDALLDVQGDLQATARATEIESRRGDVQITANDDVKLNGERVKLNC